MGQAVTVELGTYTCHVVPQTIPRLQDKLSGVVTGVFAQGVDGLTPDAIIGLGTDGVYDVLCVLIPDFARKMQRWEFNGYESAQHADDGEHTDAGYERACTIPQVRHALTVAVNISGLDFLGKLKLLKHLRGLVGEELMAVLRNRVTVAVAGI